VPPLRGRRIVVASVVASVMTFAVVIASDAVGPLGKLGYLRGGWLAVF
jgi:hypothetical protein